MTYRVSTAFSCNGSNVTVILLTAFKFSNFTCFCMAAGSPADRPSAPPRIRDIFAINHAELAIKLFFCDFVFFWEVIRRKETSTLAGHFHFFVLLTHICGIYHFQPTRYTPYSPLVCPLTHCT